MGGTLNLKVNLVEQYHRKLVMATAMAEIGGKFTNCIHNMAVAVAISYGGPCGSFLHRKTLALNGDAKKAERNPNVCNGVGKRRKKIRNETERDPLENERGCAAM